jgi:hypothetical protein
MTADLVGRYRARVLGSIILMGGGLAGCGSPKSLGLSSPSCDNASEQQWIISVTGGRPAADATEISVGETVQLKATVQSFFNYCLDAPVASVDWQLTEPAVARISGTRDATLQGRSPGETGIRATVHAPNGTTASATTLAFGAAALIRVVP